MFGAAFFGKTYFGANYFGIKRPLGGAPGRDRYPEKYEDDWEEVTQIEIIEALRTETSPEIRAKLLQLKRRREREALEPAAAPSPVAELIQEKLIKPPKLDPDIAFIIALAEAADDF